MSRLKWADVARGGAMMLVVLAHTLQLMEVGGWNLGWLDTLNVFLTAIRMPLFFLISGVFAVSAVRRGWGGLWRSRLALLIYIYILWSLIRAIWFTFVPWPLSDTHPWIALAVSPVWPTTGLWFLFALVLYLVVARLTAAWPLWLPLVLAGSLSVAAAYDVIPTGGNGVWRSVALYLFFFLLGVRLPDLWKAIAERSTVLLLLPAVVVIPLGFFVFTKLPDAAEGVARVVLSVVCVAACIVVASMIAKVRWLRAPFLAIGTRTLPIYVTHAILLSVLVPLVPVGSVPAVIVAVGLSAVAIVIALGLFLVLGPVGGVYNLPKPIARRLARSRETA
jgi:uncharacterized membrane protein YcfT